VNRVDGRDEIAQIVLAGEFIGTLALLPGFLDALGEEQGIGAPPRSIRRRTSRNC
jgi:hypothetical protein